LRLRKGEVLRVTKRQTQPIPEEELIDKSGNFTPKAAAVFAEIFQNFSTDGKMSKEQCAGLVTACTGNYSHQDDPNITRLYEQYDKDKDGFLEEKNFQDFYCDASKNKKQTVWQNLHHLNYRNDLVRGDQVQLEPVDISCLPRQIIFESK
jgi:ubiquitin carboxyl-terminal hydrolase 34